MTTLTVEGPEELLQHVGRELGPSDWMTVEQSMIDKFAEATGDHQWIHVDADRAKAESPYGATVAHGFLTLSLIPKLSKDTYRVDNAKMGVNYGLNRVRFLAPVTAGSRIRVRSELAGADKVNDNAVNLTVRHTLEIEGSDKPAAVVELIARYVF